MRGFGPYIAITEAHMKKAVAEQFRAHPNLLSMDEAVMTAERSAGSSDWRTESGPSGPSLAESFAASTSVFPGRLHVFDSRTGHSFTLTTNQGDSEILLIADGTVYYRVSDRIYRARLSATGFGPSQLVAQDPVIGDAHWAFATH